MKILAASLALASFMPAHHPATRAGCAKLFTVRMGARAADAVYSGTRHVTRRNLRLLGYIERCQGRPGNQARVRAYDRRMDRAHKTRMNPPPALAYGEWAIPPKIVKCESGYRNLAPNSAGASGYYQIIPSTWLSYGGGRYAQQAYLASKAEQDTIAARIWDQGHGSGQWVCKA